MTDSKDAAKIIYIHTNESIPTYCDTFFGDFKIKYLLAETSISKAEHKKQLAGIISRYEKLEEELDELHKAQLVELEKWLIENISDHTTHYDGYLHIDAITSTIKQTFKELL